MIVNPLDLVQSFVLEIQQKIQDFKNETLERHMKASGVAISRYLMFPETPYREHVFYVVNNKARYGFTFETKTNDSDLSMICFVEVIPFDNVFIEKLTEKVNKYVLSK